MIDLFLICTKEFAYRSSSIKKEEIGFLIYMRSLLLALEKIFLFWYVILPFNRILDRLMPWLVKYSPLSL